MKEYRAYPIDGESGRIAEPADFICAADDDAAIAAATRLVGGRDIELWEDNRLVTTLKESEAQRS